MNMDARRQYLKVLQERYFMAKSRKDKSSILDEYSRNTHQNRKREQQKLILLRNKDLVRLQII